jgi:hypothetical protein
MLTIDFHSGSEVGYFRSCTQTGTRIKVTSILIPKLKIQIPYFNLVTFWYPKPLKT